MELKLNIYNKKEIVKTCKADTYDLMFGTVEDFANLINLDELKTGDDAEIIKLVGKAVFSGMDMVKDLLKDVFDDINDEDLRHVKTSDIAKIVVAIAKFTISEISKGANGKN